MKSSKSSAFRIRRSSVEETFSKNNTKIVDSRIVLKPVTHCRNLRKRDGLVSTKALLDKNKRPTYTNHNMLSESIPKISVVDCSLYNKTTKDNKDPELLKKDAFTLIEALKNSKNNESDLNGKLNLKFKKINGKQGTNETENTKIKDAINSIKFNKPKLRRVSSVVNGSVSYMVNNKNEKPSVLKNRKEEIDEYFSFSRKNLDNRLNNNKYYQKEEKNSKETSKRFKKNNDTDRNETHEANSDNNLRLRTVQFLLENNKTLVTQFKLNYKILNKWIGYVGYLSKSEFEYAMRSIGVPYDKNLYEKLFWLFDINKDGVVDAKEFGVVNNLLQSHSLEEKVYSFFEIADTEGEGFLDYDKIKALIKNRYTKSENIPKEIRKERIAKKIDELIKMINPRKESDITIQDVIFATKNNQDLLNFIDETI